MRSQHSLKPQKAGIARADRGRINAMRELDSISLVL